jgi:hypothetical protein
MAIYDIGHRRDSLYILCDMAPVKIKPLSAIAAVTGLGLLCAQTALAEPMKCSGEQKVCIVLCNQNPKRASIPVCVTNCGARLSMCIRTGCWDNGVHRYCGLSRR